MIGFRILPGGWGAGGATASMCTARVRAKVEHQFGIIKRQFGFTRVRYRGLPKNTHRLFMACALSNLVMVKQTLLKRRRLELQATYA